MFLFISRTELCKIREIEKVDRVIFRGEQFGRKCGLRIYMTHRETLKKNKRLIRRDRPFGSQNQATENPAITGKG